MFRFCSACQLILYINNKWYFVYIIYSYINYLNNIWCCTKHYIIITRASFCVILFSLTSAFETSNIRNELWPDVKSIWYTKYSLYFFLFFSNTVTVIVCRSHFDVSTSEILILTLHPLRSCEWNTSDYSFIRSAWRPNTRSFLFYQTIIWPK